MKWPEQLTLLRHAESSYNQLKRSRMEHPIYREFRSAFDSDWQSENTKQLAIEVARELAKNNGETRTGITEFGRQQASDAARRLSREIELPDVIFVSPHLRTTQTLEVLGQEWPDLQQVKVIVDDRIREQDFGLRLLYGDWRVMQVFHPEQRPLYATQGPYWYRQPQGENIADVRSRCRHWASTLTRDFGGLKILAITHHISILAFKANMERLGPEEFMTAYNSIMPGNCSLTQYVNSVDDEDNEWFKLAFFNRKL